MSPDPLPRLTPEELETLRKLAQREVEAKAVEMVLARDRAAVEAMAGKVVVNRKSRRRAVIIGGVTRLPHPRTGRPPGVYVVLQIEGWTHKHETPAGELLNVWEMENA